MKSMFKKLAVALLVSSFVASNANAYFLAGGGDKVRNWNAIKIIAGAILWPVALDVVYMAGHAGLNAAFDAGDVEPFPVTQFAWLNFTSDFPVSYVTSGIALAGILRGGWLSQDGSTVEADILSGVLDEEHATKLISDEQYAAIKPSLEQGLGSNRGVMILEGNIETKHLGLKADFAKRGAQLEFIENGNLKNGEQIAAEIAVLMQTNEAAARYIATKAGYPSAL